jgi:Flp pilus assembly protein TadG
MFSVHRCPSPDPDRRRKGTAAVELAVCLPMMLILTFGAMEVTDVIYLKQIMKSAAFEGARTATAPGQTSAAGTASASAVLQARGINSGTVTVTPTVTASTATGTQVIVTVTAPIGSNSYMKPFVLGTKVTTISGSVTMIRQ